jgi:hypothetical protein
MAFTIAHRFKRSALAQLMLAGSAWRLTLAAGLIALNVSHCGPALPGRRFRHNRDLRRHRTAYDWAICRLRRPTLIAHLREFP